MWLMSNYYLLVLKEFPKRKYKIVRIYQTFPSSLNESMPDSVPVLKSTR